MGNAENTAPKPHKYEEELNSHHTQQQLELGFKHLPSVDPDPPLDPGDRDQQFTNEEIADQERQFLQLISEDIQNQIETLVWEERGIVRDKRVDLELDNELGVQKTLSEELEYQKAVEEEIQKLVFEGKRNEDEEGIGYRNENDYYCGEFDYELGIGETLSEELQYQKAVEQEIQNLVWEQTRNEEGIGYGNLNNYGEEGVDKADDGNGFVEGESEPTARWKEERYRRSLYPVRPDAEDCSFYMRTGACKFGSNCKFNHPFRKKNQFAKEKVKEREESPERPGQVECKYYLSSGGCKYGKACRYKHNIRKTPAVPIADFNFLSLPIRPGERECPFYMRNGSCKYGANCRFNHPDPTTVGGGDTLSGYGNGGAGPLQGASQSTMSPWSSPRASSDTGPFVPVVFPPTQGVPSPYPERNGYQWHGKDHVYPAPSERRLPTPPAFSLNTPAEINFYTPHKPPMLIDEFPERPGQPECSYFLKTGNCKYKSGCKFHHPKNRLPKTSAPFAPPVSHSGLPQRPGQNICSHYNRYGICKFGPGCKFDHPVNYGHSPLPAFVGPPVSSNFGNSPSVDDGWE